MKEALIHIAEKEAKRDVSAFLLEAVLMLLSDRGISLSPDCPEYRVLEAAAGTANANLAELMDKAIPIAKEKSRNASWNSLVNRRNTAVGNFANARALRFEHKPIAAGRNSDAGRLIKRGFKQRSIGAAFVP